MSYRVKITLPDNIGDALDRYAASTGEPARNEPRDELSFHAQLADTQHLLEQTPGVGADVFGHRGLPEPKRPTYELQSRVLALGALPQRMHANVSTARSHRCPRVALTGSRAPRRG